MSYLSIKNVSYQYANKHLALKDINLEFQKGELVAVIGQNGAGKTTLMKLLNGLYKPTTGDVIFDGKNTKDYTTAQIAKSVGYVFQNPDDQIFNDNVYEEIQYGPKRQKLAKDKVKQLTCDAIKMTNLEPYINEHPYNLPFSIRKFISIAAIIAMDTDVIILDEPTAGQDAKSMELIGKIITDLSKAGKTVIVITHDMSFVSSYFNRAVVMCDAKKIKDATPKDIFWDFDVLKNSGLKQPFISELACQVGIKDDVLSCEDLVKRLIK